MNHNESPTGHVQADAGIDALLVGYERQENLGLRSLMAHLQSCGRTAALAPFVPGDYGSILALVRRLRPHLVGFSLIFQFALDEFRALMRFLRDHGVQAHFTAGGHFPSLRPEETFRLIPELDSVVRFEGELTLAELLDRLDQPVSWNVIRGLAFRSSTGLTVNPPRPLVADLDSLPRVYRDAPQEAGLGVKMAAMLASRGCLFNCSFCSIRQFYGGASGSLRRVRSPHSVASEMHDLFHEHGVRYFSFQDDDFAARTESQRVWLRQFLGALDDTRLTGQIRWKISCRVDDLQPGILEEMRQRGLMAVYLGVESGNETGLRTLNKHTTVEQNLAAIDLLKRTELALAMGFMLFDPSSTIDSIRSNLQFLRTVGEDGLFPINFCQMLPYAGTPIEAELRAKGRLEGSIAAPDYPFLEPTLDGYSFLTQQIFSRRNFSPDGLIARLQQADFEWHLAREFGGVPPGAEGYGSRLHQIIARSNQGALDTLEQLLEAVITHGVDRLAGEANLLVQIAEREWRGEAAAELDLARLNVAMPLTAPVCANRLAEMSHAASPLCFAPSASAE
ncbi:MAG: radical SAM protein [Verrucomicrobiia bacterium]